MEQILAFVLGVGAVAFVWVVVVAFRTASKVEKLETGFQNIINLIEENRRSTYEQDLALDRRMDQEVDRVDQIYNECIRHIDSRVDKLEAKLTSIPKEILKG